MVGFLLFLTLVVQHPHGEARLKFSPGTEAVCVQLDRHPCRNLAEVMP